MGGTGGIGRMKPRWVLRVKFLSCHLLELLGKGDAVPFQGDLSNDLSHLPDFRHGTGAKNRSPAWKNPESSRAAAASEG